MFLNKLQKPKQIKYDKKPQAFIRKVKLRLVRDIQMSSNLSTLIIIIHIVYVTGLEMGVRSEIKKMGKGINGKLPVGNVPFSNPDI